MNWQAVARSLANQAKERLELAAKQAINTQFDELELAMNLTIASIFSGLAEAILEGLKSNG